MGNFTFKIEQFFLYLWPGSNGIDLHSVFANGPHDSRCCLGNLGFSELGHRVEQNSLISRADKKPLFTIVGPTKCPNYNVLDSIKIYSKHQQTAVDTMYSFEMKCSF